MCDNKKEKLFSKQYWDKIFLGEIKVNRPNRFVFKPLRYLIKDRDVIRGKLTDNGNSLCDSCYYYPSINKIKLERGYYISLDDEIKQKLFDEPTDEPNMFIFNKPFSIQRKNNEIKVNNPIDKTPEDLVKLMRGKSEFFSVDGKVWNILKKYNIDNSDRLLHVNCYSKLTQDQKNKLYNELETFFKTKPLNEVKIKPSKLLNENIEINKDQYIKTLNILIDECCKELKIKNRPKITIINHPHYTDEYKSYGGYIPSTNEIKLVIYGRDCMSVIRTLSHELKHCQQNEQGRLTQDAGEDGDIFENEANSYSGKTCRWFGRKHPEAFFLKYDEN